MSDLALTLVGLGSYVLGFASVMLVAEIRERRRTRNYRAETRRMFPNQFKGGS